MRKTIIFSFITSLLVTSLTSLAAPIDVYGQGSLQIRSEAELNLHSRSIADLIGNRSNDRFERRELLNDYVERDVEQWSQDPKQIARSILETHQDGWLQSRAKTSSKIIGQGEYQMPSDYYHKQIKPVLQSHFQSLPGFTSKNGRNPDYDIDRKGIVRANPTNGKPGSNHSATMDELFPNGLPAIKSS